MTVIDGQQPTTRDVGEAPQLTDTPARPARKYVVAIGIDQYQSWNRLSNAVNDARGALAAFRALGFEEFRPALIDGAATANALRGLITDELRTLGSDDSLVLFFAGHGYTVTSKLDDTPVKDGYLIPVDGDHVSGKRTTWIDLQPWLKDISKLPARHIFVILDACHSGIVLDPVFRWRDADRPPLPLAELRTRRSRRILTSALDHQRALDGGPRPGHSLFTGCLIEGLAGAVPRQVGQTVITGSELCQYVQHRVSTYPTAGGQTPDFGALDHDNSGQLIIDVPPPGTKLGISQHRPSHRDRETSADELRPLGVVRSDRPAPVGAAANTGVDSLGPIRTGKPVQSPAQPQSADTIQAHNATPPPGDTKVPPALGDTKAAPPPDAIETAPSPGGDTGSSSHTRPDPSPDLSNVITDVSSSTIEQTQPVAPDPSLAPWPVSPPPPGFDLAFINKLDLHSKARASERVLSVIGADPLLSLTGWATWSAHRGHLTLVSEQTELEAVIADVLGQVPWMRSLPAARALLATAAGCAPSAINAALGKRSSAGREEWIEQVAGRQRLPRVAGWLLAAFHEAWASGPDLASAPARKVDLLSFLDDLRAPITILLHHHEPTPQWLEQAIPTAAQLAAYVPRHAVAVGAPKSMIHQVLREQSGASAFALARKGLVSLGLSAPTTGNDTRPTPHERLASALAAHPTTANLFLPNVPVNVTDRERPVSVDLYAADALLAIQIDDWYRVPDRESYRRDRDPDRWLQRAGNFVTRFLAEDIDHRLERVVEEIALCVATRRAEPSAENPQ